MPWGADPTRENGNKENEMSAIELNDATRREITALAAKAALLRGALVEEGFLLGGVSRMAETWLSEQLKAA